MVAPERTLRRPAAHLRRSIVPRTAASLGLIFLTSLIATGCTGDSGDSEDAMTARGGSGASTGGAGGTGGSAADAGGADTGGSGSPGDAGVVVGPPGRPACLEWCGKLISGNCIGPSSDCESICDERFEDVPTVCDGAAGALFKCWFDDAAPCTDGGSNCSGEHAALAACQELQGPWSCGVRNELQSTGTFPPNGTRCSVAATCRPGMLYGFECEGQEGQSQCTCTINGQTLGTCDNGGVVKCRGLRESCCQEQYFQL